MLVTCGAQRVAQRVALWQAALGQGTVDDAEFLVRNAALRAAFMAADEDGAITYAHLERAARLKYEAMGKVALAA